MTPLWTSADAVAATGGSTPCTWQTNGVSIDTRSLQKGDLFVALTDVRDGHDFVAQALNAGAAAALVSRVPDGVSPDAPLLLVDDVLPALERLAVAGRKRAKAKVIGVTGSVGKTSTKEMLRAVLGGQGKVHAAEKSLNNHWGVPLTLARLPQDADFAVIEIGMNHPGEIAPLAKMARPDIAIITTVAAAHLKAFKDVAEIAVEKAAIFQGLEVDGWAIFNGDIDTVEILSRAATQVCVTHDRQIRFGESAYNQLVASNIRIRDQATIFHGLWQGEDFLAKLSVPGRHFAINALAVIAAAKCAGADMGIAISDLGRWQVPDGRGNRERIILDIVEDHLCFDLFDDAFNANPASMRAAIEVLAATTPIDNIGRISPGRRIAILGDMLELGSQEAELHREIAEYPQMAKIDRIHCVGPRMKALYDILPPHKRGEWHEKATDIAARAHRIVDAGDVILVKGSKGSKVSLVVDAIRKLGQPSPDTQREQ